MKAALKVQAAEPEQLVDRYDPKTIDGLIGFDGIKTILKKFCSNPYPSAWLLLGPSGIGKTTLASAIAPAINGQTHHLAARDCSVDAVDRIQHLTAASPMFGKWHVIHIDEADQMTHGAQLAMLSMLDKTGMPKGTVFMFTANSIANLESRFLSRVRVIQFDAKQLDGPMNDYLAAIWKKERGHKPLPDFAEVFRRSQRNVRSALMNLEMMLMDPTYIVPEHEVIVQPKAAAKVGAKAGAKGYPAKRAWVKIYGDRAAQCEAAGDSEGKKRNLDKLKLLKLELETLMGATK